MKDRVFGTSMMFGISTRSAPLQHTSFTNLIGEDQWGWGLSHKGLIWHNGKWKVYTKPFRENCTTVIGCLFNGADGTLTFFKDGVSLGIAFTGLNLVNDNLYPTVSSTAAKTEFCFLLAQREFSNLQERYFFSVVCITHLLTWPPNRCRHIIRQNIRCEKAIKSLELPDRLKSYVELEEDDDLNSSSDDLIVPPSTLNWPSPIKWYQPSISLAQLSKAGFHSDKIPMPDL